MATRRISDRALRKVRFWLGVRWAIVSPTGGLEEYCRGRRGESRSDVIAHFLASKPSGLDWPYYRRRGYRCVQLVLTAKVRDY